MLQLLGEKVFSLLNSIDIITEIRLRVSLPILVKTFDSFYYCNFIPSQNYLQEIVKRATKFSPYAYEDEISAGFIHYQGGIRIGVVGRGKVLGNSKISIPTITSLCIRIPHEIIGAADALGDFSSHFINTLVISPPLCGKTTLIREMARLLSDKYDTLYIDEREELCPENRTFKVGKRADVMQGVPKKYLYENIIRAMAPQIVVCDELFSQEDCDAITCLDRSGIKCLASFHGNNYENIPKQLKNVFCSYIFLSTTPKVGTIRSVRRRDDT